MFDTELSKISPDVPVLIAGPTASGKSALALEIAKRQGGVVVNADASQVYDCWRILTARPSPKEEACAPHVLYGHIAYDAPYSAGHWLREVTALLSAPSRPIIVGGTGLYFMALTEGLSEIPPTPDDVREEADALPDYVLLTTLDEDTRGQIDPANRARVQRAWEVLQTTGRGLAEWQRETPPPLLPLSQCHAFVLDAPKPWLTPRINARFDMMIEHGALEEVEKMAPFIDPALPSCRAIGVPEIHAHLKGDISLEDAREKSTIATRQYAKRQRTWMRRRCQDWHWLNAAEMGG